MYDSGGISLKPSDPMHLLMKMDMGGAAAVLGAFTALRDLGTTAAVSGWLTCTDNMPSGSAYKLGDVLTCRNGKTVEIKNTDAEGRIAMMDGLALAVEAGVDAIVDIATLTGAALMALGKSRAAVLGNDQAMVDAGQDGRGGDRRAGLAAAAGAQVPQAARLRRRRHLQPRRAARRCDHRSPVPRRVRRRHPVGAHRHRRHHVAPMPTTPGAPPAPPASAPASWPVWPPTSAPEPWGRFLTRSPNLAGRFLTRVHAVSSCGDPVGGQSI